MKRTLSGKRVFVTGACGTVGQELIKQLLTNQAFEVAEVVGIDHNESALFFLDQSYMNEPRARFFVLDIRDRDELTAKMRGMDIIFHCAALKHVILSERSPDQVVQTNIQGVQNVISAANANEVEVVVFASSDKAVNPTNVMGTSKLMGERLMTAAQANQVGTRTTFVSTRFGNVLGSNGSVVPIFKSQIERGGPVTLTHRDMTRFVMSIPEAVNLVIDSALMGRGGEVLVTKMPVVRIEDLARAMIQEMAPKHGYEPDKIKINEIGVKPGEKLYEELMSDEETGRALELEHYFAILPAFRSTDRSYDYEGVQSMRVSNPYKSSLEPTLDFSQLCSLLRDYRLL